MPMPDQEMKKHSTRMGGLPVRMRALFITSSHRTGAWLAEALATDSASDVILEETVGAAAGMARLRDEVFDIVLISHEPEELDALELSQGLRAGGSEEPILVLGTAAAADSEATAFEAGADAYLCVDDTTTRALLWTAARAIERSMLLRENRRLVLADRQRLQHEHQEADRLLGEQRGLIAELHGVNIGTEPPPAEDSDEHPATIPFPARISIDPSPLPDNLITHYADLLRAYVIMGSGNLAAQMRALAGLLVAAGVTPQQTMMLHLQVLEDLINGLGSRSARHVMTRADLLVLEVMVHLADGYRLRFIDRQHPPRQLELPGFVESEAA
jgi:DNA-binding NarL/FixJ family response regulator